MEDRQDAMTSESMNAAACDSGKGLQEGARRTSLAEVQAWALPSGQCCRQSRVREVYVVGSPCLPPFPPPCPSAKVLIPVFALGRAQELCLLLDEYWSRVGLGHVPIFFSAGKPVQGAQWILCVCQKQ